MVIKSLNLCNLTDARIGLTSLSVLFIEANVVSDLLQTNWMREMLVVGGDTDQDITKIFHYFPNKDDHRNGDQRYVLYLPGVFLGPSSLLTFTTITAPPVLLCQSSSAAQTGYMWHVQWWTPDTCGHRTRVMTRCRSSPLAWRASGATPGWTAWSTGTTPWSWSVSRGTAQPQVLSFWHGVRHQNPILTHKGLKL